MNSAVSPVFTNKETEMQALHPLETLQLGGGGLLMRTRGSGTPLLRPAPRTCGEARGAGPVNAQPPWAL